MAGVRKKPRDSGKFQGWFTDATGKRRFVVGTRSRTETLRMAERLEDEHRQVRLGYRPPPTSADRHRGAPFGEIAEQYLAWGDSQGGRGGRPWSAIHARNRRTQLTRWQERLGLTTLGDLDGILPRVEKELQALQTQGRSGKTLSNYVEGLAALCDWCQQRGYLSQDPLSGLAPFDTTPQTQRRAMTRRFVGVWMMESPPIAGVDQRPGGIPSLQMGPIHLDDDEGFIDVGNKGFRKFAP